MSDDSLLISGRGLMLSRGDRPVIDHIDIDIHTGEIVTVLGPNGAGKTTLVRILLGLISPDSGTVVRRKGLVVGYAPQSIQPDPAIPMTVSRFLRLSQNRPDREIDAVLDEVGARQVRDQQIASVSGGELRRVVLARALLRRPHLLVLDEPAQGVDHAGEAELYSLIASLRDRHRLGVLLISHDLHVVMAKSDRVLCINRHVCCSGVPHQVARDPEYARLFGADAAHAVAIYHHDHDHHHDLAGQPLHDHPPRPPA